MTQTEQAIHDLRDALKAELIEELKTWWEQSKDAYEDPADAIDDAVITLEAA